MSVYGILEPTPPWDNLVGETVLVAIYDKCKTKIATVDYVSSYGHGVRLRIGFNLTYYLPNQIKYIRHAHRIEKILHSLYRIIPAIEWSWFGECRVCKQLAPLHQDFNHIGYRIETCGACGARIKAKTSSGGGVIMGEYINLDSGETKTVTYKKQLN